MRIEIRSVLLAVLGVLVLAFGAAAQVGNSGSIEGVVRDPSGSAVPGAAVEITYGVSGFHRTTTTGTDGRFRFVNVPFNPYHLSVAAEGFGPYSSDVEVRSSVATTIEVSLKIGTQATTVTVESGGEDLVENSSTFHTDVDRNLFKNVPLESMSSSVSSLVTLTTPGVAADRMDCSTGWGITRRIRFRWTVSQSRTSRAKCFPTRFRRNRFSHWK